MKELSNKHVALRSFPSAGEWLCGELHMIQTEKDGWEEPPPQIFPTTQITNNDHAVSQKSYPNYFM